MRPFTTIDCPTRIAWATAAILALNLALSIAHAGEWQVMLASRHIGDSPASLMRELDREADNYIRSLGLTPDAPTRADAYNEINPGLVYHTEEGWYAGVYLNSEGGESLAAGRSWDLADDLSVSLGLVTGYESASVLPQIGVHYDLGMVRLSAVPYVTSSIIDVVVHGHPYLDYSAEREGWGVVVLASFVFGGE